MRAYDLLLSALLVLTLAGMARGEEVLLGRVVELNEEEGTATLEVLRSSESSDESMPSAMTIQLPPDREGMAGIAPGSMVRVWGGPAGTPSIFSVKRISLAGPRGMARRDPTGVRQRLGRGRMFRGGGGRGPR